MALERLQKVLARAGVASRRGAEELIEQGLVTVDGRRVDKLGTRVDSGKQEVRVRGKLLQPEKLYYVLFHKPRGVMCTMSDPEGRPTVRDYVRDVPARVVPIGRLDFHTSGVLLLSNDGDFALALVHPSKGAQKTYVAKVRGQVDDRALERWREPIVVGGRRTRPADVRRLRIEGDKTWLQIELTEGRNRHVHRLGEATGNTVLRLARVAFAGLTHEGVRPGRWRYLEKDELVVLKKTYGVPARVRKPPKPPAPPTKRTSSSKRPRTARPARAGERAAKGKPSRGRERGSSDRRGR